MLTDHWPLRRLRLTTERLVLRQPDEEELAALADVAANGVHKPDERPFLTPWTEVPPAERARSVLQGYWSTLAEWTPQDWALKLGVFRDTTPLGMVTLRAQDFAVLREVKTTSWLGLPHHRQGFGTEARQALLHLAFHELDAEAALTEVFQSNAASQGVSRKLGYRPDGISRDVLDGQAVVSDRLRLTRDNWSGAQVRVDGLEGCRDWFVA